MSKELKHSFEGKTKKFSVRVTEDCVYIKTENKLLIMVSIPDMSTIPERDYELEVNVADHAALLVRGTHKNEPELLLMKGEFPTKLQIDESEGPFIKQIPFIVVDPKVAGYA